MQLKNLDTIAAGFAKRNAAKAAKLAAEDKCRQFTHCVRCKHEFRRTEPTCTDKGVEGLCYDCSEGGVVS